MVPTRIAQAIWSIYGRAGIPLYGLVEVSVSGRVRFIGQRP